MSKKEYSNDLIRFHRLMNINESEGFKETPISKHKLYKNTVKLSPDGRIYGVVQEGNKYFIKTALLEEGKNLDTSDFSYLGGLANSLKGRYNSYSDAIKRLDEGILSEKNIRGDIDKKSKLIFEAYLKEADDETVVDGEPKPEPKPQPDSQPSEEPEMETEPEVEVEPEQVSSEEGDEDLEASPEGEVSDTELGDDEEVDMGDETEEPEIDMVDTDSESGEDMTDEDDIKSLAGKFIAEVQKPEIDDNEKVESINQMIGNMFGYLKKNSNVKTQVIAKIQEKIQELEGSAQKEVVENVKSKYRMAESQKKSLKGDVLKMINEASKYNPKIKMLIEKLEKVKSKKIIKENTFKKRQTSKLLK